MFTVTRSECQRVAHVLQAWLDGEADPAASTRVVEHLETCRACGLDAVDRLRRFADAIEAPGGMESSSR